MKIVVVAETYTQFKDYVEKAMESEKRILDNHSIITIEELQFIWVHNAHQLRGKEFNKGDMLIHVGSWYNIPLKDLREIKRDFTLREA